MDQFKFKSEEQRQSTQRVFDEALKHIRAQGQPSIRSKDNGLRPVCMYRNPEGLGCAFAPAIKHYSIKLDRGHSARDLLREHASSLHDWAKKANALACCFIQAAHDNAATLHYAAEFMPAFERRMRQVAKDWTLDYAA